MKARSGIGKFDAAGQPAQQRDAQVLFQLFDLTADRPMGDTQILGGIAEVKAVCRSVERLQCTKMSDRGHSYEFISHIDAVKSL